MASGAYRSHHILSSRYPASWCVATPFIAFNFCPVGLDGLRMDACHGINKILDVVDSGIGVVHVGVELPVGSPLVAVDDGTVPNDPLDDRDEGLCPTVRHKLHVAHSRGSGGIAQPKYPLVRCGGSTTVVLGFVAE